MGENFTPRFSIKHNQSLHIGLCLAFLTAVSLAESAPSRPNIVLILADDLGWKDLGVTGSKVYETPNIDQLARDGMLFTDAYAANPLCSPTRAGLLTGLHPQRTGFTAPWGHVEQVATDYALAPSAQPWAPAVNATSATRLDTRFLTYAELLREAGYVTAHFGKWHLGYSPHMPKDHGFDVDIPGWNVPGPVAGFLYPWDIPNMPSFPGKKGDHIETRLAEAAGEFIRENKAKPFFVNFWAFSVHSPYNARPELIEKYRQKITPQDDQRSPTMAAMIESFDDAVGILRKSVEEAGLSGKTVFILTSDNGGVTFENADPGIQATSNAPLKSGKGNIYEGGTRVPLIVDWPGVTKPGSVSSALVQTTDLFPTVLAMAGVPLPESYPGDGSSLVPILTGKADSVRDAIYCYFPHNVDATGNIAGVSVRKGNEKLIRFFCANPDGSDHHELYDLAADPGEENNLAGKETDRVKELGALLDRYLAETGAPSPGPNPHYDPSAPRPPLLDRYHPHLIKASSKGESVEPSTSKGEIVANRSFESPRLVAGSPLLTPRQPSFRAKGKDLHWEFGFGGGVCLENHGHAESRDAAEGSQMAFLQGDANEAGSKPGKIWSVMGTDLAGLTPGQEYELTWQEVGCATDLGVGAVTVTVKGSGQGPATILQTDEPVASRQGWQTRRHRFTATHPMMRLNFRHTIAKSANPSPGTEATLFDAVTIEPVQ